MKIAITDYLFPDLEFEAAVLEPLGHEIVAMKTKGTPAEMSELVRDADAVITQFAPVTAEVILSMQRAKVIVRYGIGVDNVDLDAAQQQNIPVCNIPDYCIDEVADQTLAFVLAATRQVVPNSLAVQAGEWRMAAPLTQMRTLKELTVGVVGFGRIGREVVSRLRPFKCRIQVFDPVASPEDIVAAGCEPASLEQVLCQSDVLTLHCPSTAQTKYMLNRESLSRAKRGVIIVNLSRGNLIDSAALLETLQSGQVSAAALDVFDPEPIPADHPLLKLPNVVLASHIASCSVSSVKRLRETAAQLAANALSGAPLDNVVNGVTPAKATPSSVAAVGN